jgi:hypothetical protein
MNVYEALGTTVVIFVFLVGSLVLGYFAWKGINQTRGELDIARLFTDSALRESICNSFPPKDEVNSTLDRYDGRLGRGLGRG